MKSRLQSAACVLWLVALPFTANGEDSADNWLARMGAAMSQMSYQGTFVYVQGDEVETLRITHVFDEQGSRDRLVSISGSPREVFRDAHGVKWITGQNRQVISNPAVDQPFFPELPLLGDPDRAAESYDFRLAGKQRIAGHSAQRINILPRDMYRYGYSLWLEVRSGMMLKWQLNDGQGDTLAKLMFTDVKMGAAVDPGELSSGSASEDIDSHQSGLPSEGQFSSYPPRWKATRLPAGFRLASYRQQSAPSKSLFEHQVYTDGIAAVSVYLESLELPDVISPGLRVMGTTHVYSRSADDVLVTVLGDVPAATVKLIGDAMAPAATQ